MYTATHCHVHPIIAWRTWDVELGPDWLYFTPQGTSYIVWLCLCSPVEEGGHHAAKCSWLYPVTQRSPTLSGILSLSVQETLTTIITVIDNLNHLHKYVYV